MESRGGCQAARCKHPSHSEVGEDPWCQGLVLMCPWVTVVAVRGDHLHMVQSVGHLSSGQSARAREELQMVVFLQREVTCSLPPPFSQVHNLNAVLLYFTMAQESAPQPLQTEAYYVFACVVKSFGLGLTTTLSIFPHAPVSVWTI